MHIARKPLTDLIDLCAIGEGNVSFRLEIRGTDTQRPEEVKHIGVTPDAARALMEMLK
jgi:hypothetical protein